jgi:hypothetical protein
VLQVNSNPVIPITLQLGSLEETVSGRGGRTARRDPETVDCGVVTHEQVEALPLEGRNPTALIVLAGAAADTGPPTSRSMTTSRGIAITGGQPFAVSYLLDGAMHNNVLDGLNLPLPFPGRAAGVQRRDQLAERTERTPGSGTVNVVTKSGTNLFHGDLFEFARHHRFNAASPFAAINRARGSDRMTDWCVTSSDGTIGGPVATDRLFFFARVPGHARDANASRHHHLHSDSGDARRRLHAGRPRRRATHEAP